MSDPHMAEEGLVGEVVVEAEGMVGEEGEAGLEMTVAAAGKGNKYIFFSDERIEVRNDL